MGNTNQEVAQAWSRNEPARSHNGNFRTDGYVLFSYNMNIGITEHGRKILLNVRRENFYSMTTSQHVGLAAEVADEIVEPVMRDNWAYWPDAEESY